MEEIGDEEETRCGAKIPSVSRIFYEDEGTMPDCKKKLSMSVLALWICQDWTNFKENELV